MNTNRTNKALPWGVDYGFKALDWNTAQGTFMGYAARFGNVDQQGDIIERGAFARTLRDAQERQRKTGSRFLYPILFMHEAKWPIGGILSAREDAKGLLIDGWLDLSNAQGKDAFAGMSGGYVNAFSIGYNARKATRDKAGNRHLLDIDLTEVSCITQGFASNPEALLDTASVKSTSTSTSKADRAVDQQMARLEAQARGLDWRSQRLPLSGNPNPPVYYDPNPSPDPSMPRRAEFVTDRLWHEALDDWAAKQRGPDAARAARERDQREFDAAVARERDARVRAGRATFAEQEAYAREHGHTGDGRPAPDTDAAATAYIRDAYRALEAQRDAYHDEHGYTIPTDDDR